MAAKSSKEIASDRILDQVDRNILRALQAEGRLSNVELARRVNLSPTPCLERVRRLEREGYIKGYRAILDPMKLDAALMILVQVTLDRTTPETFEQFRKIVEGLPEVLECHMVSGGFDYLLKVRMPDMATYRKFLGEGLAEMSAIAQTHSYVVMEEVKTDSPLPIHEPLEPIEPA